MFDVLQDEVEKLTESAQNGSSNLPFTAKVRYLWNENTMRDIREQLRGLQQALVLLLQVLGAYVSSFSKSAELTGYRETMVDLKYRMDSNTTVLQQLVDRTSRFSAAKGARPTRSIFDMSVTTRSITYEESVLSATFFTFDDEIVGSHAYRRALAKAFPLPKAKEHGESTEPEVSAAANEAADGGTSALSGRSQILPWSTAIVEIFRCHNRGISDPIEFQASTSRPHRGATFVTCRSLAQSGCINL